MKVLTDACRDSPAALHAISLTDSCSSQLSSAHVYLRLTPEMKWDAIPTALLDDLSQLVKANSIEGNKKQNVTIIYTPWSNIKVRAWLRFRVLLRV